MADTAATENKEDDGVLDGIGREEIVKIKVLDEKTKKPVVKEFVIRDFSGKARGEYLDSLKPMFERDEQTGEAKTLKTFVGFESNLIKRMLHYKDNDEFVPEEIILSWSSAVQIPLYEMCRDIAALDEEAEVKAKNV